MVILISSKFMPTVSEVMESALKQLSKFSNQNGLRVNPSKTELIPLTKRNKINSFPLPRLDRTTLNLSTKAKYLGILDSNFFADEILKRE